MSNRLLHKSEIHEDATPSTRWIDGTNTCTNIIAAIILVFAAFLPVGGTLLGLDCRKARQPDDGCSGHPGWPGHLANRSLHASRWSPDLGGDSVWVSATA